MTDFAVTNITWDDSDFTTMSAAAGMAIVASQTAVITPTGPLENMHIEITNTYAGAIVPVVKAGPTTAGDRKSTRLNSSHLRRSRMPSSA
jgi:hypothetical protein